MVLQIFIASRLAPDLLGAIAVAAYSYMALVPIIQASYNESFNNRKRKANKNGSIKKCKKSGKNNFSSYCIVFMYIGTS